ncbi:uncharacterized protein LOC131952337 isoform X2 [Physella acuta]|uniref:uncharacterized protein LOC131952337 isoform X2 n=1 Tax=Physella acuta TaxID=109671 RepID=UPI0027DC7A67|nr:uncharacterized protein LOC131952337 isoform X2 [Physella acuta]
MTVNNSCHLANYAGDRKISVIINTRPLTTVTVASVIKTKEVVHSLNRISVTEGEWILVFRGQAFNNVSLYSTYINTAYVSDGDLGALDLSSISKTGDNSSAHFRSRWLNTWPSNITQVKLELYDTGKTVMTMLFNATGSNYNNWFTIDRLVQSPYNDISNAANFSTNGESGNRRRFLVTKTLDICSSATVWFMVEDRKNSICLWSSGTYTSSAPVFTYSKEANGTLMSNKNFGIANVLAIFIKF